MSTRVCSPPSNIMMDSRPTSGNLPSASANQATPPRSFIFGAGLRRSSSEYLSSSDNPAQPVPPNQRKVVRCLFGPPDPRSGQFAREKVLQILEQDKNKWDYDFVNDRPVDGPKRFIWEAVPCKMSTSSSQIPTEICKQSTSIPAPAPSCTMTSASASISKSRIETDSLLIIRSVTSSLTSTTTSTTNAKTVISSSQTKITDFMPTRKRRAGGMNNATTTATGESPPPEKKTAL